MPTNKSGPQRIEHRLSRSLKGFTLEKTDIGQLEQIQQKLVISMKLSDPGYGQVRGPLMLVRPRVLGEKVSRWSGSRDSTRSNSKASHARPIRSRSNCPRNMRSRMSPTR